MSQPNSLSMTEGGEPIPPEEDIWRHLPWLREIRQQMYEETRGLSHAEEIAYWRRKAAEYDVQRATRPNTQEGDT